MIPRCPCSGLGQAVNNNRSRRPGPLVTQLRPLMIMRAVVSLRLAPAAHGRRVAAAHRLADERIRADLLTKLETIGARYFCFCSSVPNFQARN